MKLLKRTKLFFFYGGLLFISFSVSVYAEETKCSLTISDSLIMKTGNKIQITNIFGFKSKPELNSNVIVLPYPKGEGVKLKIVSAQYQHIPEMPEAGSYWAVNLEDASNTPLKNLKPYLLHDYVSYAAIMWPVPPHGVKVIKVVPSDLPPNVFSETTQVAIDLDNDKKADALVVEFACENRHVNPRKTSTDYTCSETWQKVNDKWLLCDQANPL